MHWAGGNPFHHHQDLQRLQRAFRAAETIVVHEPFWTSTARHADVVFAATTTLEREDVGAARYDDRLIAMGRVHAPLGEARDDYAVLSGLAHRLGTGERFTEGRTAAEWVEHLYEEWRTGPAARSGITAPPYAEFVAAGEFELPPEPVEKVMFASFRADPDTLPAAHPQRPHRAALGDDRRLRLRRLPRPPGVAGAGGAARRGVPAAAGREQPRHPPAQPARPRRHVAGGEGRGARTGAACTPATPPRAASPPGRSCVLRSRRGSCLAGLVVSDAVREGVVQMSTGAWFDPVAGAAAGVTCGYGNVNVLTRDVGSSRLSQACTGQHATVQVSAFEGVPPRVTIFDQPT